VRRWQERRDFCIAESYLQNIYRILTTIKEEGKRCKRRGEKKWKKVIDY